jgi:hypothetical protein
MTVGSILVLSRMYYFSLLLPFFTSPLSLCSFEVKKRVEEHIRSLCGPDGTGMGYSFLRPVQFMENLLPDAPFLFKIGRTVLIRYTFVNHPERKHQFISSRDIGRAGSKAFTEGPGWQNGIVRLAGDGLTMPELQRVYEEVWISRGMNPGDLKAHETCRRWVRRSHLHRGLSPSSLELSSQSCGLCVT